MREEERDVGRKGAVSSRPVCKNMGDYLKLIKYTNKQVKKTKASYFSGQHSSCSWVRGHLSKMLQVFHGTLFCTSHHLPIFLIIGNIHYRHFILILDFIECLPSTYVISSNTVWVTLSLLSPNKQFIFQYLQNNFLSFSLNV